MHAPAEPHGPFVEILPDVFVVTGSFRMRPLVTIPRNMIVLRSGQSLALVNPIRLTSRGEAELEALGRVEHLVRIGLNHNTDLPYCRERYETATFWDTKTKGEPLVEGARAPFDDVRVFSFRGGKAVESALVVERPGGNLLVTCDSIQNWEDTRGCSPLGALVTRVMGFIAPARIGPFWLKALTDGKPAAMRDDFERLLALDFAHVVGGHGAVLRDVAKGAIEASCRAQGVFDRAR